MSAVAVAGSLAGIPPLDDLLEEIKGKNHVRVQVFRACTRGGSRWHKRVLDEEAHEITACGPSVVLYDAIRALAGRRPVFLAEAVRRLGGELRGISPNLRTTVGADYVANALGGTQPSVASWIAISGNTSTPAAGDSSATAPWSTAQATDVTTPTATQGEWTGLGLTRVLATYAHTNGTASYTQTASWTATATSTLTRMAGMFGGSTKTAQGNNANNVLFLENTFTATTLATNDQLSLTWTVNV